MPQIGWDILSETEINDMMRLLDPCVLPSPPVRSSPYVNPYALPANSGVPQKPAGRAISQKQLQALTKKHLLLMLRDSEKELAQAKELLEAYQAMLGRGQGTGGRRLYE
ncbi:MAG: hypothetical protein FWF60_02270 [Oscillospiraceae bacterium]|nr:hypothetical protein [Oscillospiraceae bacterium]